ncbi:hypothetical protein A2331_02495 [Candidatus Falkowbacteria bacterium RIFOXYB2_FULL_34_18]|uniref:CBS domain-containing protein n=1 Tax=Candidatus Falkowbacteria bacterium RIFOXYD2_FULL_34_120 TaxID=1798007 RepID=A0A1F5TQL7_9BACT|nr:MAG: hypothetical protein A2331_02495 [Candidatus Falkowbacteria bacterium RIFOXYB2_FULL_34_18]OGF29491.1 MAG: hypothetical protein A2500_04345 [Candidatus Falkowbacteria bacterium RIFOXYC12_FULL_34_55]OGF36308.1 MAG: hypothetical protein A2466_05355 [Candidatus Falkowbacteria bacterium RIFOXYC2_FULL_34_220]OGF39017.1 MAG: hypothetical protein A2515_06810 [Candidatus Falkowbacteria bacterium RIFOXYD12_FULL_34_57]OGF41236.1 MAG: hypothetical protein A2531_01050 [Candidatus Falkowbacteria bact
MKENSFKQIIHKLSFAGKNRRSLFLEMPDEKRAQVLLHLSKHIQYHLMSSLSDEILVDILNQLDPDEATDLIQLLSKHRQNKIIQQFNNELKKSVEILNQFDPRSAAGLMNLDYIQVGIDEKISDAIKQFRVHEKRTGHLPVILALDEGKLKGYLPGHKLGFAKLSDRVQKHIRKIQVIRYNATHDQVVDLFRTHPHNKIVVMGNKKNIIGVIYADDILRALKEEETSALYDFAGVHDEESVTDGVMVKVKHRYKWLIINLGTAFLAASTVGLFNEVISKYVLLAMYMPIVAGMGGNAGTQTLAVLVRGIALNQIDLKTVWPTLRREATTGIINGLVNGILVASVVVIFNKNFKVAFVLGVAMVVNLFVAGFFGTLVPVIMKKLGKDPATSATVFITTATDVLGFMVFLGLATMILD